MAYPNQLANGRGNLPDAAQLMANFNAAVQKAGDTMTGSLILNGGLQLQSANPTQISNAMNVAGLTSLANPGYAAVTINSFVGGVAGQVISFFNDSSSNSVTFVNQGTGTQTFDLPGLKNIVVGPFGGALLYYDAAYSVWTVLGVSGALGTQTNDNAFAGAMGELITSSVTGNPAGSAVIGTYTDTGCSIALTAGDWDVWGWCTMLVDGITGTYPQGVMCTLALTDNANSVLIAARGGIGNVGIPQMIAQVNFLWPVKIASTTTYKTRFTTTQVSSTGGIGSLTALGGGGYPIYLAARRVR